MLNGGEKLVLIAAGGRDEYNNIISSVETLLVTKGSEDIFHFAQGWESGPSMPVPLRDAASATSSDQKALYE